MSTACWIQHWARVRPDATCVIGPEGVGLSYPMVLKLIQRRAHWLSAQGLQAADRIMIETADPLEQRLLRWAVDFIGAPEAVTDPRLSTSERQERRQLLKPAAVLADPLPRWPDQQQIERSSNRGDCARILFTTGSTGTPKAVLLGGEQLARVAAANVSVRGLRSDDRYVAMLPAFHAAGSLFEDSLLAIGGAILLPLQSADSFVFSDGTLTSLLPSQLQRLAERGELDALNALRLVNYAGERIQLPLLRLLLETFHGALYRGYGLTEAGPLVSVLDDAGHRRGQLEPDSAGRPAPGVEVRIDERNGELLIRSPFMMIGYFRDPDATTARFVDGWLRTGDLADLVDGEILLRGRLSSLVRSGGEWIDPGLIERCLSELPGIEEAVVIGEASVRWGERPVAFVRTSSPITAPELRSHLAARLPRFKWPDRVEPIEQMPRNAIGKTDRKALAGRSRGTGAIVLREWDGDQRSTI